MAQQDVAQKHPRLIRRAATFHADHHNAALIGYGKACSESFRNGNRLNSHSQVAARHVTLFEHSVDDAINGRRRNGQAGNAREARSGDSQQAARDNPPPLRRRNSERGSRRGGCTGRGALLARCAKDRISR